MNLLNKIGLQESIPCVVYCKGEVIGEYSSQEAATKSLKLKAGRINDSIAGRSRFSIIHNGKKVMAVARYKH